MNPIRIPINIILLYSALVSSICFFPIFSAELCADQKPRIVFEETSYDFGIAGPGEKITHTFRFANPGSGMLKIEKVSTDCGCTAALVSEKEIPPEGKGAIKAVFETRRYEGKQEKTITVYSNAPDNPKTDIIIKGTIKRDVAVVPQGIHFRDVEKGETVTGSVKLLQLSQDKLILQRVQVNEKYMTVKTAPFTEENSRGIRIDIILKPSVPVGAFSEVITLHTNLRKRPRIDVPVWANIPGPIRIQPKALSFGAAHKGETLSQSITLSSRDGRKFRVLKVTCDMPFIKVESFADDKSNTVKIKGSIDKISPAGRVALQIEIHTDVPDQKVIYVPVYGVIKK